MPRLIRVRRIRLALTYTVKVEVDTNEESDGEDGHHSFSCDLRGGDSILLSRLLEAAFPDQAEYRSGNVTKIAAGRGFGESQDAAGKATGEAGAAEAAEGNDATGGTAGSGSEDAGTVAEMDSKMAEPPQKVMRTTASARRNSGAVGIGLVVVKQVLAVLLYRFHVFGQMIGKLSFRAGLSSEQHVEHGPLGYAELTAIPSAAAPTPRERRGCAAPSVRLRASPIFSRISRMLSRSIRCIRSLSFPVASVGGSVPGITSREAGTGLAVPPYRDGTAGEWEISVSARPPDPSRHSLC